jgi:hypothetical protein
MPLPAALYKLTFETPTGHDHGVAYLTPDGRIRGGDSGMAYVGTYSQAGERFTAELTITQHRHVPGVVSALGYNDVAVQLEGWAEECSAEVTGTSRDNLGIRFRARLTMIAD